MQNKIQEDFSMENVLVERKDGLGIMTLNRPKCLNAMNGDLVEDFHAVLSELEKDENIRVIILTGAGRAFCAGGDLNYLEGLTDDLSRRNFIERVGQMTLRIRNCAKPVIAMVNGVTAGAGVNLMLACDIVCSSENAKFIHRSFFKDVISKVPLFSTNIQSFVLG